MTIASATPGANRVPKADALGKLVAGWMTAAAILSDLGLGAGAAGDLIYGTGANTLGRLSIAPAGQLLVAGATAPEYSGTGLTWASNQLAGSGGSTPVAQAANAWSLGAGVVRCGSGLIVDGVGATSIQTAGGGQFAGALATTSTTDATSTTSAALKSAGGLAVAKKAYVGEYLVCTGFTTDSGNLPTTAIPVMAIGSDGTLMQPLFRNLTAGGSTGFRLRGIDAGSSTYYADMTAYPVGGTEAGWKLSLRDAGAVSRDVLECTGGALATRAFKVYYTGAGSITTAGGITMAGALAGVTNITASGNFACGSTYPFTINGATITLTRDGDTYFDNPGGTSSRWRWRVGTGYTEVFQASSVGLIVPTLSGVFGATAPLGSERFLVNGGGTLPAVSATQVAISNGGAAFGAGVTCVGLTCTAAANFSGGALSITRASSGQFGFSTLLTGDTQQRFVVEAQGLLRWGAGGVTAPDTTLYRSAAGTLTTDGALTVGGLLTANASITFTTSGATGSRTLSASGTASTRLQSGSATSNYLQFMDSAGGSLGYFGSPASGTVGLYDGSLSAILSGTTSLLTLPGGLTAAGQIVSSYSTTPSSNAAISAIGTATLTVSISDGFLSGFAFSPTYNGAFTVTRHNYINMPSPSGTSTVTDACVIRFPAAAGTHKAVDGATTKASPGSVDAWVKININGTIHYLPAYLSKTA